MSGLGTTVWQVEQDEFCRSILARHWPEAERFEDVREVGSKNLSRADIICGGFPCQDLSSARTEEGEGLAGSRSGLWYEFARIIKELQPAWVVVENVASGAPKWVDGVTESLEQCGYETLPITLSAFDVGAPHKRSRVFIIASNANANSESVVCFDEEAQKLRTFAGGVPFWAEHESLHLDDGISLQLDVQALGNAVVPQCAEVIGYMIQELSNSITGVLNTHDERVDRRAPKNLR